jgi:hypothetical protein
VVSKSSLILHIQVVDLHYQITIKNQTVMKITNVIATSAILVAIAFSTSMNAQTVQQTKDNKAKNKAKLSRAEKNGHPKAAVKDEKKVQKDNKKISEGK